MSEIWLKNVRLVSLVDEPAVDTFTLTKRVDEPNDEQDDTPETMSENDGDSGAREEYRENEQTEILKRAKGILADRDRSDESDELQELAEEVRKSMAAEISDSPVKDAISGEDWKDRRTKHRVRRKAKKAGASDRIEKRKGVAPGSGEASLSESPVADALEHDRSSGESIEKNVTEGKRKGVAPYQGDPGPSFTDTPLADAVEQYDHERVTKSKAEIEREGVRKTAWGWSAPLVGSKSSEEKN